MTPRKAQFELVVAVVNMLRFTQRGFGRAFITRSASGQGAVANEGAASSSCSRPSDTALLDDNLWLVNSKTPDARVLGLKWTPGLWARAAKESGETNRAIFDRIKAGDITTRDLFNLTGVGFTMWGAFIIGSMIGKWKIFGHRGQEPHHGHGMWTDAPVHH